MSGEDFFDERGIILTHYTLDPSEKPRIQLSVDGQHGFAWVAGFEPEELIKLFQNAIKAIQDEVM